MKHASARRGTRLAVASCARAVGSSRTLPAHCAPSAIDAIRRSASAIAAAGVGRQRLALARRAGARGARRAARARASRAADTGAWPSAASAERHERRAEQQRGLERAGRGPARAPPSTATPPPPSVDAARSSRSRASAAAERIENSSLRSTAVPITTKLISVANVVSAHTALLEHAERRAEEVGGEAEHPAEPQHRDHESARRALVGEAPRATRRARTMSDRRRREEHHTREPDGSSGRAARSARVTSPPAMRPTRCSAARQRQRIARPAREARRRTRA